MQPQVGQLIYQLAARMTGDMAKGVILRLTCKAVKSFKTSEKIWFLSRGMQIELIRVYMHFKYTLLAFYLSFQNDNPPTRAVQHMVERVPPTSSISANNEKYEINYIPSFSADSEFYVQPAYILVSLDLPPPKRPVSQV